MFSASARLSVSAGAPAGGDGSQTIRSGPAETACGARLAATNSGPVEWTSPGPAAEIAGEATAGPAAVSTTGDRTGGGS